MGAIVLSAEHVTRTFFRKGRNSAHDFAAVDDVSLELASGELLELKGRSGSGKSTLLNMLGGLLAPTSGTVQLEGTDLYALGDAELSRLRNGSIGMVPQGRTALNNLTVAQNVALPWEMYRAGSAEPQALALLAELGIEHLADSYPPELSGGELRRVAIARALVCDPRVILADEPTGDLDDENTLAVLRMLRARADSGAAVLLVTHEQAAADFADRVVELSSGKLKTANETGTATS